MKLAVLNRLSIKNKLQEVALRALNQIEKLNIKFSKLPNHEIYPTELFEWTKFVESKYDAIHSELIKLLNSGEQIPGFEEVLHSQKAITNDTEWKTFFFLGCGQKVQANCDKCPQTWLALQSIPNISSAFFSILLPNKSIPPHRGFYNGVLRYHLGLIVPIDKSKCFIQIGASRSSWARGESLIFDYTFTHYVANTAGQLRVILFVDFPRPMRFPWSLVNHLIITLGGKLPDIQTGVERLKEWQDLKQVKADETRG